MADFTALPIRVGNGDVHVNYFRTFIRPYRNTSLPTGAQLLANMPRFMHPHSAVVWKDTRRWRARDTLTFRGVARLQPFSVPVDFGLLPLPAPIAARMPRIDAPEWLRQLMIPQLHIDSVALATPAPFPHSFTVQTLKRNFETSDDMAVRYLISQRLRSANPGLIEKATNFLHDVQDLANPLSALTTLLGEWAVTINQYHFLAGRRSFLIGTAAGLEVTAPGVQPGDWVFETAALERYSLGTYRYATDFGMGGAAMAVRPVWLEMGQRLAHVYGQPIGQTIPTQYAFASIPNATGSALFKDIASRHRALIPGLP